MVVLIDARSETGFWHLEWGDCHDAASGKCAICKTLDGGWSNRHWLSALNGRRNHVAIRGARRGELANAAWSVKTEANEPDSRISRVSWRVANDSTSAMGYKNGASCLSGRCGGECRAVLERLQLKARLGQGTSGAGLGFVAPVHGQDPIDEHAGVFLFAVLKVHLGCGNAAAMPIRA